ncbi:hypothetical protein C8Q79DRAFT_767660 [Trametes meyenii]|nr:hypothetical protein C8Q79DRAFT_767660 [Trametes meyenii]
MTIASRPFCVLFTVLFLIHVVRSASHRHNRLGSYRLHTLSANGRDNSASTPAQHHFSRSRFTWFRTGQNACGSFDQDNEPIVAISSLQWDNGVHCHKPIVLEYQGQTARAWVTDKCADCAYGAISMSRSLFTSLVGDLHIGAAHLGSWAYDNPSASAARPDDLAETPALQHSQSLGFTPTLSPSPIPHASLVIDAETINSDAPLSLDETRTIVQLTSDGTQATYQFDDAGSEQLRLNVLQLEMSVRAP